MNENVSFSRNVHESPSSINHFTSDHKVPSFLRLFSVTISALVSHTQTLFPVESEYISSQGVRLKGPLETATEFQGTKVPSLH